MIPADRARLRALAEQASDALRDNQTNPCAATRYEAERAERDCLRLVSSDVLLSLLEDLERAERENAALLRYVNVGFDAAAKEPT